MNTGIDNDVPITGSEITSRLSYVGSAVVEKLRMEHSKHHQSLWNVTNSKMIGSLQQTPPPSIWNSEEDPVEGHSNFFAEKICEIMSKTRRWCDVIQLEDPDGYFLEQIKKALKTICGNSIGADKPIIIRFMFGIRFGTYLSIHYLQ